MAKAKKVAKAARAAKGTGGKKKGGEEMGSVVVASKVRQYVRGKGVNMSSEIIPALNVEVLKMLDAAVLRVSGNNRKTLRPVDL